MVQREIGIHKPLQVTLALYELAHTRRLLIYSGYLPDHRLPLSVECRISICPAQCRRVYGSNALILFHQIAIVLLTHIVVGYNELEVGSPHLPYGQHAVIEQQADKALRFDQVLGRERLHGLGIDVSVLGNLVEHAAPVAIQLVQL